MTPAQAESKLYAWEKSSGGAWGYSWDAGRKGGDIACVRFLDGRLIDRVYADSHDAAVVAAAEKLPEMA